MRKYDTYFLQVALETASKSDMRQRLGAVIVDGKRIISKGYNRWCKSQKLHSIIYDGKVVQGSIHAEIEALRRIHGIITSNLTLYVVRDKYQMAKPCDSCMKVLLDSPISRVVFSSNRGIEELRL